MKKNILSNKQKKDLKYFTIMTLILWVTFELLKHFNQFNFISFLVGQIFMSVINSIKVKIYRGGNSNE